MAAVITGGSKGGGTWSPDPLKFLKSVGAP